MYGDLYLVNIDECGNLNIPSAAREHFSLQKTAELIITKDGIPIRAHNNAHKTSTILETGETLLTSQNLY